MTEDRSPGFAASDMGCLEPVQVRYRLQSSHSEAERAAWSWSEEFFWELSWNLPPREDGKFWFQTKTIGDVCL